MIKNSYGIIQITPEGNIFFDTANLKEIGKTYETPFFLMSEKQLIGNYENFLKAFAGIPNFAVFYSVKTDFESEVLKTLRKLGSGAEIAGGQDFLVAKNAGFAPEKIIFDGPCKNEREIIDALEAGIHCFNMESVQEMKEMEQIASKKNIIVNAGIRIDPLVDKNYYDVMIDTYKRKFGFPIDEARQAVKEAKNYPHLKITAIHMHIGSQITSTSLYVAAIDKAFKLISEIKEDGTEIKELNIGGGYPAQSIRTIMLSKRLKVAQVMEMAGINLKKKVPSIFDFGEEISKAYHRNSQTYGLAPKILTEPGRCLVSDIAVVLGKVRVVKNKWLFVDFGVNNLAENMFFAERDFGLPGRMNQATTHKVNISGPTLSTADVIYLGVDVPDVQVGDPMVVFDAGAYSIPRSTQFTQPRIAVYFITKEGQIKLIRSKETFDDVIRNQIWQ